MDELYEGPHCLLSIVDNRKFRRLTYEILDHSPTQDDIEQHLAVFRKEIEKRGLTVNGITTDGSNLYPEPLANFFPGVSHQSCQFHIIKEINKAILKAVTRVRRELARTMPRLSRGRPSGAEAKRLAQKKKRVQKRIGDLFEGRYLFVKRRISPAERRRLHAITRGIPHLRTLRSITDEVYRLFDRRCRVDTALKKLRRLRARAHRFTSLRDSLKKLDSPNLEKALVFLDDKLLPSTSNAVERGNRRHRKMQRSVYRVRTTENLNARIAMDMLREERAHGKARTAAVLKGKRNQTPVSLL